MTKPQNSPFLDTLHVGSASFTYVSLRQALGDDGLRQLPCSLKILCENVARCAPENLTPLLARARGLRRIDGEIPFFPNRVLMHDTTCVPALVDFAAMRDAVADRGGDPGVINPVIPVDLVIDHSVIVDHHARPDAIDLNLALDFQRNGERYRFIKWAQNSLSNFRVVPPGMGILHQLNLELLADVVNICRAAGGSPLVRPDTLLGTDSHTPMVNALGVLGWGVGGVEAQAAMLGEPIAIRLPEVIGISLSGALQAGVTATDLALFMTELLRRHGVVGKFVEFFGPGLDRLSLADRATVANMAPEYGATCAFFPIDAVTLDYLRTSNRLPDHRALIEAYVRIQGLWRDASTPPPRFDGVLNVDLASIEPCVAGPRQPHERKTLKEVAADFQFPDMAKADPAAARVRGPTHAGHDIGDGAVVLAAITSCTNTSNPALVIGAGLLARNARRRGLQCKPWVKTSFSPGSRVVSDYLTAAGLQRDLDALGFHVVGFGCMTCIGNSGELMPAALSAMEDRGVRGVAVLSGNRNFDGRVNRHVAAAYLASPALVVAYALAGSMTCDLSSQPIGADPDGVPVYLRDIWPSDEDIDALAAKHLSAQRFDACYRDVWAGSARWKAVPAPVGVQFRWSPESNYLRRPPYFEDFSFATRAFPPLAGVRPLLMLGDNVTTDHISPAGAIPADSMAGKYLIARGVAIPDLNQYSTRRGNHEVMLRGAFSNPKLVNELLSETGPHAGAYARSADGSTLAPVYEAAQTYRSGDIPLAILAGKNYGAGSSRDWAAKAQVLLGVRVLIAESFERIHRSNLIGLGVIPLLFGRRLRRRDLCQDGFESLSFDGLNELKVGMNPVVVSVSHPGRAVQRFELLCQIDSWRELDYLRHRGVLPYIVRGALRSRDCAKSTAVHP